MRYLSLTFILVVLLLLPVEPGWSTIYIWTDENGVKYYSDTPPPEGIENYTTAESIPKKDIDAEKPTPVNEKRPDAATQPKPQETQDSKDSESTAPEAASTIKEIKGPAQTDDKWSAQAKAEEERLLKEIDALKNMAVPPKKELAFKQRRLKELEEKLQRLRQDPQKYFSGQQ